MKARHPFRDVLMRFPTGVVVVTAVDPESGRPTGLTVSAFCSVSVDPDQVLVCLGRSSRTVPSIERSKAFTINILAAGHEQLALKFASKDEDKFDGLECDEAPLGGPILTSQTAAHLCCRVANTMPAGDHLIFIGEVAEVGVDDSQLALLYHRRAFSAVG